MHGLCIAQITVTQAGSLPDAAVRYRSERRRAGEPGDQPPRRRRVLRAGEGELQVGAGLLQPHVEEIALPAVAGAEPEAVEEPQQPPGPLPGLALDRPPRWRRRRRAPPPAPVPARPAPPARPRSRPAPRRRRGSPSPPRAGRARSASAPRRPAGKSASPTAAARSRKAALSGRNPESRASGFQRQGGLAAVEERREPAGEEARQRAVRPDHGGDRAEVGVGAGREGIAVGQRDSGRRRRGRAARPAPRAASAAPPGWRRSAPARPRRSAPGAAAPGSAWRSRPRRACTSISRRRPTSASASSAESATFSPAKSSAISAMCPCSTNWIIGAERGGDAELVEMAAAAVVAAGLVPDRAEERLERRAAAAERAADQHRSRLVGEGLHPEVGELVRPGVERAALQLLEQDLLAHRRLGAPPVTRAPRPPPERWRRARRRRSPPPSRRR